MSSDSSTSTPSSPEAAAILRRAVVRYLDQPALPKPVKTALYADLLVNLGLLALAAGADDALDTVLLMARTHAFADPSLDDEVRRQAVSDLAGFSGLPAAESPCGADRVFARWERGGPKIGAAGLGEPLTFAATGRRVRRR